MNFYQTNGFIMLYNWFSNLYTKVNNEYAKQLLAVVRSIFIKAYAKRVLFHIVNYFSTNINWKPMFKLNKKQQSDSSGVQIRSLDLSIKTEKTLLITVVNFPQKTRYKLQDDVYDLKHWLSDPKCSLSTKGMWQWYGHFLLHHKALYTYLSMECRY